MKNRLITFTAALLYSTLAQAAVPLSFTHHGVLKENDSVVNGQHAITVSIVDQDGNVAGTFSDTVDIKAGLYNVTIDNIDAAMVSAAQKLLLKVTVDDQELNPALPINAVPYALSAYSADSVACTKCIKPEQLTFNALQDSALPVCDENQVLKQEGANWVCSDVVNLDNNTGSALINGRVGINTGAEFLAGTFSYSKVDQTLDIPDNLNVCECDKDDNNFDCPETFTTTADNGARCYDKYGPAVIIFQRDSLLAPLSDVVVVDNGKIGVGTGRPEAPLHIRALNGNKQYEAIIADTEPAILLEDLDGKNYRIAATDQGLELAQDEGESILPLVSINESGTSILGTVNATSIIAKELSGDFKIGNSNLDINYAGSTSKGGAATDLVCSNPNGCVNTGDIVNSAVTSDKVNFNYAASSSKGGAATSVAYNVIKGGTSTANSNITYNSVTSWNILDKTITKNDLADSVLTPIAHGRLNMNCPSCNATNCSNNATLVSYNIKGGSAKYNPTNNYFTITLENGSANNWDYTIIAPNMTWGGGGPTSVSLSPQFTPGHSGSYNFSFVIYAPNSTTTKVSN